LISKTNTKGGHKIFSGKRIFGIFYLVLFLCGLTANLCLSDEGTSDQERTDGKRVVNAAFWGFDKQNATHALQSAIRSGASKVIVPDMGKPWIVDPIFLESDQEIIFEKGVRIIARKGGFQGKNDSLFEARNKENIVIKGYGAEWFMQKKDYQSPLYERSGWRHCLTLRGCRNVTVAGLRIKSSGGDGIYVGRGHGPEGPVACVDIEIHDIQIEDHHRQGISVISTKNLFIENCTIRKTRGTKPQFGIDFEPNNSDELLENIIVRNCLIENNEGGGIQLWLGKLTKDSSTISIKIEGCRIWGNKAHSIRIAPGNISDGNLIKGRLILKNNQIDRSLSFAAIKGFNIEVR
jgi:hypothetical protein